MKPQCLSDSGLLEIGGAASDEAENPCAEKNSFAGIEKVGMEIALYLIKGYATEINA